MTAPRFAATMVPVMRRIAVLGSLALCSFTLACASTEPPPKPNIADGEPDRVGKPITEPKPEPKPAPTASVAIASVQMIEDCPSDHDAWRPPPVVDPSAAAAAPAAAQPIAEPTPMPGAALDVSRGDSPHGWTQPCTQSTMQLVLTNLTESPAKAKLEVVRLLDPKTGKEVAKLEAREPAAWADGAYQSWNESLGPRQAVKASYELSVPDWSAVEKTLGVGSSFGAMFLLEVEVKVGDERQTVRSPQFPREQPHVIVT
jgi:hypothetical protein